LDNLPTFYGGKKEVNLKGTWAEANPGPWNDPENNKKRAPDMYVFDE